MTHGSAAQQSNPDQRQLALGDGLDHPRARAAGSGQRARAAAAGADPRAQPDLDRLAGSVPRRRRGTRRLLQRRCGRDHRQSLRGNRAHHPRAVERSARALRSRSSWTEASQAAAVIPSPSSAQSSSARWLSWGSRARLQPPAEPPRSINAWPAAKSGALAIAGHACVDRLKRARASPR